MSDDLTLAEDVCRDDRDRYQCAMLAPPERRQALFALIAFYTEIAQISERVSEPLLGSIRLQWWRDAMEGVFSGNPVGHPVALALSRAISEVPMSRDLFEEILAAREVDMLDQPPEDLDKLEKHIAGTSGALNALMGEALGHSDCAAVRQAGTAYGLVQLLIKLPGNVKRGRVFLPADLCHEAGFKVDEVASRDKPPGLANVIESISAVASRQIKEARKARLDISRELLPVMMHVSLAEEGVRRLSKVSFDPFHLDDRPFGPGRVIRLAWHAFRGTY